MIPTYSKCNQAKMRTKQSYQVEGGGKTTNFKKRLITMIKDINGPAPDK
jgi:hypothetical protein